MREFFPTATGRNVGGVELSFGDSLEAAKIILSAVEIRMELLRYEDVPVINERKLQADINRLLSE